MPTRGRKRCAFRVQIHCSGFCDYVALLALVCLAPALQNSGQERENSAKIIIFKSPQCPFLINWKKNLKSANERSSS
jgi:hypothetical protein